jgi:hypothetical protein
MRVSPSILSSSDPDSRLDFENFPTHTMIYVESGDGSFNAEIRVPWPIKEEEDEEESRDVNIAIVSNGKVKFEVLIDADKDEASRKRFLQSAMGDCGSKSVFEIQPSVGQLRLFCNSNPVALMHNALGTDIAHALGFKVENIKGPLIIYGLTPESEAIIKTFL